MSKKSITTDEVKHIAKLSKLNIKDSELDYYAEEMNKIIDYFDTLSKIDTSDVTEMVHVSDIKNVTRKDQPGDCIENKICLIIVQRVLANLLRFQKYQTKNKYGKK